jgi:hypothetical protein
MRNERYGDRAEVRRVVADLGVLGALLRGRLHRDSMPDGELRQLVASYNEALDYAVRFENMILVTLGLPENGGE